MKVPKGHIVRHPYERVRIGFKPVGESRTHQSHASSVDVNTIVRRFENNGVLPGSGEEQVFADVTDLQSRDFTQAIEHSRDTLHGAGRALEERRSADKAEREAQREADRRDAEQFRLQQERDGPSEPDQ